MNEEFVSLREWIAEKIYAWLCKPEEERIVYELIDEITKKQCEEIEKGLLTDEEIGDVLAEEFRRVSGRGVGRYFHDISPNDRVIAQAQLQKILSLFRK